MRVLVSLLLLASCARPTPIAVADPVVVDAGPPPDAAPAPPPTVPPAPRAWMSCASKKTKAPGSVATVRDVDWCNLALVPGFSVLHDGVSEVHEYAELGGMHDTMIRKLGSVAYGDLDADGVEEAAVVIDEQDYIVHAPPRVGASIYLFAVASGKPLRLASGYVHAGARVGFGSGVVAVEHTEGALTCKQLLRRDGDKLIAVAPPSCVK